MKRSGSLEDGERSASSGRTTAVPVDEVVQPNLVAQTSVSVVSKKKFDAYQVSARSTGYLYGNRKICSCSWRINRSKGPVQRGRPR